jgi:hypothetical protein
MEDRLFLKLRDDITRWARESRSTGNATFYWYIMSVEQFREVAAHAPRTVAELSALGTLKARKDRENFVNDYGSQVVGIVHGFIEQEKGLEDYVNWRPMKRPIEQESLPIKFPMVASRSTAKIAQADDGYDEFPSSFDWTVIHLGQQQAGVASNMNTHLIAADSGSGSVLMHGAAVAPNNNTPGGAVTAAAAVESAQVCDNSSILAGVVAQKTDADVSDTGNPASGEIEKAAGRTITIDDNSESESDTGNPR